MHSTPLGACRQAVEVQMHGTQGHCELPRCLCRLPRCPFHSNMVLIILTGVTERIHFSQVSSAWVAQIK